MVFGFSIAVTAVPSVYQCAETHRIALGCGMDSPSFRHVSVYLLRSSVFIGLPCPKNTTGILGWAFAIRALCQVEQQQFGAFALFKRDFGRIGSFQRVARLERLVVRGE